MTPEDAGLPRVANLDELRGGTAEENARVLTGILSGQIGGARRDVVLLNAAAAFVAAGLASGLAAGVERAAGSSTAAGHGMFWINQSLTEAAAAALRPPARREGRCSWQYSSPSEATRNS